MIHYIKRSQENQCAGFSDSGRSGRKVERRKTISSLTSHAGGGRITDVRKSVDEDSKLQAHHREGTDGGKFLLCGMTEHHLGAALIRHGDSVIVI